MRRVSVIKFSRCPIAKHKGELWEKLNGKDLDESMRLLDVDYIRSLDVTPIDICADTFHDFDDGDWGELMQLFYGQINVLLIKLKFWHPQGIITTYRKYTWQKAKYYQSSIGKTFRVIINE